MIIIFSQDEKAIRELARNQANASQATFGTIREAFKPARAAEAKEPVFIVADDAKRLIDYKPAIGDKDVELYWNALQAVQQLDPILPLNFSADIYVAARSTADPRSDVNFASTLRDELLRVRKNVGKVYGLSGSAHGPIPAPGDGRWIAV